MSRVKYDMSRVPRELLERFVSYQLCLGDKPPSINGNDIVKAAEVPLRTRAEVDADIVKAVRDYCKDSQCPVSQLGFYSEIDEERGSFSHYIEKLLLEETSD